MTRIVDIIIKIYGQLLRLYPRHFREEFGGEMLADFLDMADDARRKGKYSLILFYLRELIDFPINLLRIHWNESPVFKVLRSQPVNNGLRSGFGFGIVFALTVPISIVVYDKLFFWLDSLVTQLQLYYYDRFHTDLGSELSLWIPSTFSALATGLILGISLALLFAERSKYPRYIFAGLLGWFLHHAVGYIFSLYNFWGFLTETQFWIFDCMLLAFSGAIFGLVFVIVKSEQRLAMHWLMIGAFVYLLFVYLSVKQLFNLFIFQTPWRFVGVTILVVILIASVFVVAIKMENQRRLPWGVVTGTIAYPTVRLLLLAVDKFIYPSLITTDLTLVNITVTNGIYGILFGLLLGLGLGSQKENNPPQLTT